MNSASSRDRASGSVADIALTTILSRVPTPTPFKRAILDKACQHVWASPGSPLALLQILPPSDPAPLQAAQQRATGIPDEATEHIPRLDLAHVDLLSGREFERFLGTAFEQRGYQVQYDAGPTEAGGDLVCWERSETRRHAILVQAKRERCVTGTKAIGQILRKESVFRHEYPAATYEKWVVSTSRFSAQARTEAEPANIRLVDREGLALWLTDSSPAGAT